MATNFEVCDCYTSTTYAMCDICMDEAIDHEEKLVIGDWVFTKRGERVVMALATLTLLTVMLIVGSIE